MQVKNLRLIHVTVHSFYVRVSAAYRLLYLIKGQDFTLFNKRSRFLMHMSNSHTQWQHLIYIIYHKKHEQSATDPKHAPTCLEMWMAFQSHKATYGNTKNQICNLKI